MNRLKGALVIAALPMGAAAADAPQWFSFRESFSGQDYAMVCLTDPRQCLTILCHEDHPVLEYRVEAEDGAETGDREMLSLQIDGGPQIDIPATLINQRSDGDFDVRTEPLDDALLDALRSGTDLAFGPTLLNDPVTQYPLRGSTAAIDSVISRCR
ncbi:hypothetical protein ACMA5I_00725 [Paracoccaceae bacterium GXU_MW_L88]